MRKRVKQVDTVSPPITARAIGMFFALPSPIPSAIGTSPATVAMLVMRIGRSRVVAASRSRSSGEWRASPTPA
jgi:hypothetical protein